MSSRFGIMFAAFVAILASTPLGAQKRAPANPLDLNTATLAQLQQLPRIGPTRARAIIEFRQKSGPFERVEDLLAIRGISKSVLKELRPYVTVVRVRVNSP